jgi:anti-sigma factor RsiW
MAMDCGEFGELVAAWALGALDDSERAACAAHLAGCDPARGCHASHRDACLLAERLAGVVTEHPIAPRVWNVIEERVRAEGRGAAIGPPAQGPTRPRHLAPV